jgi:ATP-dependent Clp protease adapter protein ClpS
MMTLTIPDDMEQELKIMAENSQMTPSDFIVSLLQTAFKQQ